jgi:hypothetical protein
MSSTERFSSSLAHLKLEGTSDKSIFPFFKLARELRNNVYQHLSQDKVVRFKVHPSFTTAFHIRHYLSPKLLRINRQFTAEYRNEIFLQAELVISIHGDLTRAGLGSLVAHYRRLLGSMQSLEVRLELPLQMCKSSHNKLAIDIEG